MGVLGHDNVSVCCYSQDQARYDVGNVFSSSYPWHAVVVVTCFVGVRWGSFSTGWHLVIWMGMGFSAHKLSVEPKKQG